jgi:hypothetical protein
MAYDAVLRNIVVHEYFRVNPELILDIVDNQRWRWSARRRARHVAAGRCIERVLVLAPQHLRSHRPEGREGAGVDSRVGLTYLRGVQRSRRA